MRIVYVLSEHAGGLSEGRLAAYEADRERIEALAGCPVESLPYEAADRLDADVLVLSGSSDPWAAHDASALDRHLARLHEFDGPVLGICAGMQNLVRVLGGTIGRRQHRPAQPLLRFDRGAEAPRRRGEAAPVRLQAAGDEPDVPGRGGRGP